MEFYKKHFISFVGVALIGLGILAFILIGNIYAYNTYSTKETYGGDAYTGMQNATVDVVNAVDNQTEYIEEVSNVVMNFVGIVFIVAGVLSISYDVVNIKCKNNEKTIIRQL